MAKKITISKSVTITSINDGATLWMSSPAVIVPVDGDGNNPVLTHASTLIRAKIGDSYRPIKVTGVYPDPSGVTAECKVLPEDNTTCQVRITGIPKDCLAGCVTVKLDYGDGETQCGFNFSVSHDTSGTAWVNEWNGRYTQIGENWVVTPKIFAGTNVDGKLTGVYLGKFSAVDYGLYGYDNGRRVFSLDSTGAAIGGWQIKENAIQSASGKLTLNNTGSITSSFSKVVYWSLNEDGSVSFARGNIIGRADGSAEFNGKITAAEGKIASWNIRSGSLDAPHICIHSNGQYMAVSQQPNEIPGDNVRSYIQAGGVGIYYISDADYGLAAYSNHQKTFSAGTENFIAGWNFDHEAIWLGKMEDKSNQLGLCARKGITIGSNGIRGIGFYSDITGAGAVAGGKIKWDAQNNVIFDQSIRMLWELKNRITSIMSVGKMMYRDPSCSAKKDGQDTFNGMHIYNDESNKNVSMHIQLEPEELFPNGTSHYVKIVNKGVSSPECGGITFKTPAAKGKIYLARFIARIPKGRRIQFKTHPTGDGSAYEWLTSVDGTGEWCEYAHLVTCGTSGEFGLTNYFYITGEHGTEAMPVEWDIAYATVFDATDIEHLTTHITGEGVYTGIIEATQIRAGSITSAQLSTDCLTAEMVNGLSCTFKQGSIGGWTIGSESISKNNVVFGSDGTVSNGHFWKFNNDGSGYVGEGCIIWKDHETVIDGNVKIKGGIVSEEVKMMRNGAENTFKTIFDKTDQQISSIVSDVRKIHVINPNLLLGTDMAENWMAITNDGDIVCTPVMERGVKSVRYQVNKVGTLWNLLAFKCGDSYRMWHPSQRCTLSFDIYSSVTADTGISIMQADSTNILAEFGTVHLEGGKWQHIAVSTTLKENAGGLTDLQHIMMTWDFAGTFIFQNLKLEEGDAATAWTPATRDAFDLIEQNKSAIVQLPGSISMQVKKEVLAGNLLINSTLSNAYGWDISVIPEFGDYCGYACMKCDSPGEGVYCSPGNMYNKFRHVSGALSCGVDVYVEGSSPVDIRLGIETLNDLVTVQETGKWVRIHNNNIVGDFTNRSFVCKLNSPGVVYFRNVKLEYGSSASDWSAAPEEMEDSRIQTQKNTAALINLSPDKIGIKIQETINKISTENRNYILDSQRIVSKPDDSYRISVPMQEFKGKTVTVSCDYRYDSVSTGKNADKAKIQVIKRVEGPSGPHLISACLNLPLNASDLHAFGRISGTAYIPEDCDQFFDDKIYTQIRVLSGVVELSNLKLEIGDKATGYIPAPEDRIDHINILPTSPKHWIKGGFMDPFESDRILSETLSEDPNRIRLAVPISVEGGRQVVCKSHNTDYAFRIAQYDSEQHSLGEVSPGLMSWNTQVQFQLHEMCRYIMVVVSHKDYRQMDPAEILNAKIKLEYGRMATGFSEYQVSQLIGELISTGIDIENHSITLTAGSVFIKDTQGNPMAIFQPTEKGGIKLNEDVHVTNIDADRGRFGHLYIHPNCISTNSVSNEIVLDQALGTQFQMEKNWLLYYRRWGTRAVMDNFISLCPEYSRNPAFLSQAVLTISASHPDNSQAIHVLSGDSTFDGGVTVNGKISATRERSEFRTVTILGDRGQCSYIRGIAMNFRKVTKDNIAMEGNVRNDDDFVEYDAAGTPGFSIYMPNNAVPGKTVYIKRISPTKVILHGKFRYRETARTFTDWATTEESMTFIYDGVYWVAF